MLYYICGEKMTIEEASKLVNKPIEPYPGDSFLFRSKKVDLNSDELFKRLVREIDNCDIPMKNVLRNLATGDTYPLTNACGGTKAIWMIGQDKKAELLHTNEWFGDNCYQALFDLSKGQDIYLYDCLTMWAEYEAEFLRGEFYDILKKRLVKLDHDDAGYDYFMEAYYGV